MPPLSIEERLAALETKVAELHAKNGEAAEHKDWRRTVGMFTDKPGVLAIFEEAMKLREADRAKARDRRGEAHRKR